MRVTVHHKKHNYQYYKFLSRIMADSGLRYNRIAENICTSIPPWELADIIRKRESFRLVMLAGMNENRAEKILNILNENLPPEKLLELEEVSLNDWVELELLDGLKWKPSHMLSKGQICTAVLPLLLLDSEQPLIIDQPEDHLDNAYIYSTVVSALRNIKTSRQVILATHNANIPVLGRAEKNTVLESNGQRGWVNASGGLDDLSVLELLELLLEGGHDALNDRLKTYNGRGK
ncbi:MAG: ATP-binding protein [Desulfotomaculum sp.]|nr:ATP-binding protein [Desulfotomaculum sp.]